MNLLNVIPIDPFTSVVAGAAILMMILAIMLLWRSTSTSAADPNSPTNLCLKCLDEGRDAISSLEFVADWGPKANKREFHGYVKSLKQGRPLDEVLDHLRVTHRTAETELLIACLTSKVQTGQFSAVSSEIVRQAAVQRESALTDLNFIIGGSRWWVIGLSWVGILGGAMLVIAIPIYSQAMLKTPIGRLIMVIILVLEAIGLFMGGRLLSLPARLEREINEP